MKALPDLCYYTVLLRKFITLWNKFIFGRSQYATSLQKHQDILRIVLKLRIGKKMLIKRKILTLKH